jgi:hypothetical protein
MPEGAQGSSARRRRSRLNAALRSRLEELALSRARIVTATSSGTGLSTIPTTARSSAWSRSRCASDSNRRRQGGGCGVGGADAGAGSGLRGLADPVEALGGSLEVLSPAGAETTLRTEVPKSRGGLTPRTSSRRPALSSGALEAKAAGPRPQPRAGFGPPANCTSPTGTRFR